MAAKASISTLRYEVAFRLVAEDGIERLELVEESLLPINLEIARKSLGFPAGREVQRLRHRWRTTLDEIRLDRKRRTSGPQIRVHQEGHGGRTVSAPRSSRTIVGGTVSSDSRPSSPLIARWSLADAAPRTVRDARCGRLFRPPFHRLARRQSAERDGAAAQRRGASRASICNPREPTRGADRRHSRASVYGTIQRTETLMLEVRGRDGVFHPADLSPMGPSLPRARRRWRSIPRARGVICLEEPENGIHPDRIGEMIQLLEGHRRRSQRPDRRGQPCFGRCW